MKHHSRFIVPVIVVLLAVLVPVGLVAASTPSVQTGGAATFPSEAVLVAIIGFLAGLVGSFIAAIPAWIRAKAESQKAVKESEHAAQKTDLDKLELLIGSQRSELDRLTAERERSQVSYQRLSIELEQEREKRRKLSDRMETFENLCADKDRELEALRCEVDLLRNELKGRDQRIAELTAEVVELRDLVEKLGGKPPRKKTAGR